MATNDDGLNGKIQASAQAAIHNYNTAAGLMINSSQTRDSWALVRFQVAANLAVADEVRALRYTLLELAGAIGGVR